MGVTSVTNVENVLHMQDQFDLYVSHSTPYLDDSGMR